MQIINGDTLLATQYRRVVKLKNRAITEEINRMMAQPTHSETERIKWSIITTSNQYGVDDKTLLAINNCESGLRHQNVIGDNGRAYGTAQFHYPTFLAYCDGNYYDYNDQIRCQTKMIKDGLEKNWTCAKSAGLFQEN